MTWGSTASATELVARVLSEARQLLELGQISYTYGGHAVVDDADLCEKCAECLDLKKPLPKTRVEVCPLCQRCSLDCSHYLSLVFKRAGLPIPYLDTNTMIHLSASDLLHRYRLVDLGRDLAQVRPGDWLVYHGHVVLVEHVEGPDPGWGDILHATAGRDVKGGGQGVQRARRIQFDGLRGPVVRILRHLSFQVPGVGSSRNLHSQKLRPIKKRRTLQDN